MPARMDLLFYFCLFIVAHAINGAKILFIPAHNIASHTKSMYPFAEMLASRNHDVYMLQLLRGDHDKTKGKKVKDIYLEYPVSPTDQETIEGKILWTAASTNPIGFIFPWQAASSVCKDILNDSTFSEQFFKIARQHWDIIIVDSIFAPCGVLASSINGAPWVDMSTSFLMPSMANVLGLQWKPAYMPCLRPPGVYDPASFYDRFWNTYDSYMLLLQVLSFDYMLPRWTEHETTRNLSFSDYESNSLIGYGSMPYELDFPHPKGINVVEMDGSCPKTEALPEHYRTFVEDPKSKGTILFAMGHFGDWQYAPPSALQAFVDAFNELTDYRIIWQYVNKGPKPNVGKHVYLDAWIPQAGILFHNKTTVFISHMGFKSIREAICANVPVVAMPMFAEQLRNAAIAKKRGFGEFLNKLTITKAYVLDTLKRVLNDPSYKKNVAKVNTYLTDRIEQPLDLGAFWMDFILRHKKYVRAYLRHKLPISLLCEYSPLLVMLAVLLGFTTSII